MDENGRFLPYWYRDHHENRLKLEPLVDMETSLYYHGCKELFINSGIPQAMMTEPYMYEGKMIVEQTFPIIMDGKFKGIAGVDRALSDIVDLLQEIKEREKVDVLLVSKQGKFVASTINKKLLAKSIKILNIAIYLVYFTKKILCLLLILLWIPLMTKDIITLLRQF